MDLSDYKESLIAAISAKAAETSDETLRSTYQTLVERLREMDASDKYMQDACREHGALPDQSQRDEALRTALSEFGAYDAAEQLATVFLIDLVGAAKPQDGFA